jgi:uncharacterized protein
MSLKHHQSNLFDITEFGKLDSVIITKHSCNKDLDFYEDEGILIHLTITGRCYARCLGCINSAITLGDERERNTLITAQEAQPHRDVEIIRQLTSRYSNNTITICFYGGEPFLCPSKFQPFSPGIKSIDSKKYRFLVYSNGEMLSENCRVYPEFMEDIWLYSISIDGREEQHNRFRLGTKLNKIIRNLYDLREIYKGNVLYWSTLREGQSLLDCFEGFYELYQQKLVDHFFWHWAESREPLLDFQSYANNYAADLRSIMKKYVEELAQGRMLPITHINELILYLITGKDRGHTACGVEVAKNYDIVSGKVYTCADLPSELSLGELDGKGQLQLEERDLNELVEYKTELGCYRCGVHNYCGGRCPVQVVAGSKERTLQYCKLMRLHVRIVQDYIDEICRYLTEYNISLQNIYDSSAFMAKYTDVVP